MKIYEKYLNHLFKYVLLSTTRSNKGSAEEALKFLNYGQFLCFILCVCVWFFLNGVFAEVLRLVSIWTAVQTTAPTEVKTLSYFAESTKDADCKPGPFRTHCQGQL